MAAKKNTGKIAEPVRAASRAFEHGKGAAGAALAREGWGLTPDDDLAYALGYPVVRRLVEGNPDDAITDPDRLAEIVYTMPYETDVPLGVATVAVRALPVLHAGHVRATFHGTWKSDEESRRAKEVDPILRDRTPVSADEARALIVAETAKDRNKLRADQMHLMLLLEAMHGPDLVVDALVRGISAMPRDRIVERQMTRLQWAFVLAVALLRLPPDAKKSHGKTLADVLKSAGDHESDSLAEGLDYVLRGKERLHGGARPDANQFLYAVTDAPDLVAAYVKDIVKDPAFYCDARLATLGGEEALQCYASRWKWVRDSTALRAIPTSFGRMRSPTVVRWMVELATGSKIKRDAMTWLTTNAAHAKPVVSQIAKEPGALAPAAKEILAKLPT